MIYVIQDNRMTSANGVPIEIAVDEDGLLHLHKDMTATLVEKDMLVWSDARRWYSREDNRQTHTDLLLEKPPNRPRKRP